MAKKLFQSAIDCLGSMLNDTQLPNWNENILENYRTIIWRKKSSFGWKSNQNSRGTRIYSFRDRQSAITKISSNFSKEIAIGEYCWSKVSIFSKFQIGKLQSKCMENRTEMSDDGENIEKRVCQTRTGTPHRTKGDNKRKH